MARNKKTENYLLGIYNDDEKTLEAVHYLRGKGIKIDNVFSPFPIHGIENALGYKRSRLPVAGFLFGMLGTTLAFTMMTYMLHLDWPMDIGGKPSFAFPDFIPIMFELTVLIASLGMVATYLISTDLLPGFEPEIADPRQTDDRFVIKIASENDPNLIAKVKDAFQHTGAVDIKEKEMKARD